MTDPRELLRRLKATEPYPAQAVVAGRHRLEADPDDPLNDLTPYARDQAKLLHAVITEMKRRDGGGV